MTPKKSQPTYKRQRYLLDFIKQLTSDATETDLQKLIFLHTVNGYSSYYDFIPYQDGPYSFQLAEDLIILEKHGFLTKREPYVCAVDDSILEPVSNIEPLRGESLLKEIHEKYPYYAIHSEIADRLFPSPNPDELRPERENIRNEILKLHQTDQMLFTIGYEGKSMEAFINQLITNDVRFVCDVRNNPVSRKFGFSQKKIQPVLNTIGIQYLHIPELGIEAEKRKHSKRIADYQRVYEEYLLTLSQRKTNLEYVYSLLCDHLRIALMCYEKDARLCHRHAIRRYLESEHGIEGRDL